MNIYNQIVKSKSDFLIAVILKTLWVWASEYRLFSIKRRIIGLFILHDEPSLTKRSERTKQQYLHDLSHFLRYIKESIGTIQELSHNEMEIYFIN